MDTETCEDCGITYYCDAEVDFSFCPSCGVKNIKDEDEGEPCCHIQAAAVTETFNHDRDCENYDGAPVEQWEVTEPRDVYWSGTGEDIGDDSYIDYLNRY